MKDVTIWTSFYWRDYIADTGHLTLAQHGAYLLLMAHYYVTGNPIPNNQEQVFRICRCMNSADRKADELVLTTFFTADGNVWRHGRIEEELAKALELKEKRREFGRRGGLAKASNLLAGLPEQNSQQNPTNHNHNHNSQSQKERKEEGEKRAYARAFLPVQNCQEDGDHAGPKPTLPTPEEFDFAQRVLVAPTKENPRAINGCAAASAAPSPAATNRLPEN